MDKWQRTLDVLAEILTVPAPLITRVWPEQIEVLVASVGSKTPIKPMKGLTLAPAYIARR